MAKRDTSLNVDVNGDVTGIETALRKGGRDLKQYERSVNSAKRALDELERESLKASALVAKAERDMARAADEHEAAQRRAWQQTRQSGSALGSLSAAAALVSPAVAAAGASVVAFGALAAPSIYKVVAAQSDMATLWDTLDGRQKVAALSTQALIDDYKNLAKSYEPEALAAYNNVLGTTRQLLPEIEPLARNGAVAFNELATQVGNSLTGPQWSGFFNLLSQRAIPDMRLLGNVAVNTGDAFTGLATDLLPLGETLLQGAGGVTKLLAELSQASPTAVQLGVSMWALHKPAAALTGTFGSMGGKLGPAVKSLKIFGGEAKLSSIATGLLKDAAGGLPGIITGAAVVAGALAIKFGSMKTSSERAAAALVAQNNAVGNNLVGYRKSIAELSRLSATQTRTVVSYNNFGRAVSKTTMGQTGYTEALKQQWQALNNVKAGANQLARSYGLTQPQAIALANAAGVDLSKALDKSGNLTAQAWSKIAQYRQQVQLAKSPTGAWAQTMKTLANNTLDADTRMKALEGSIARYIQPAITASQSATALKNAQVQLARALKDSNGKLGNQTQKQRDAQTAFDTYANATVQLAHDQADLAVKTGKSTNADGAFRTALRKSLPKLYAYAGNNKNARTEVDALATAAGLSPAQIKKLDRAAQEAGKKSKTAAGRIKEMNRAIKDIPKNTSTNIQVKGNGSYIFSHPGKNSLKYPWSNKPYPKAGGGPVHGPGGARADMAGVYALSNDEFVVNAPASRKYRPLLEQINEEGNRGTPYRTSGLAGGGLAGGLAGGGVAAMPYMEDNVRRGYDWEKTQVVKATAADVAAYFKKLIASSGGGGGARRWAPLILQALAMLGMPTSLVGGVEALINRESGGNPNAINLWDSNARAGHPSQGLMQTIPGTFAAYAGPFRGLGITNPLANIFAGLNYIRHRYPSLAPIRPGWSGGYDTGGMWPSGTAGVNMSGKPERVLSPKQTEAFERLVSRLPVKRLDVPATAAAGSGDQPYIGSLTVQTTERASADQIIDAAFYEVRVAARGGVHAR